MTPVAPKQAGQVSFDPQSGGEDAGDPGTAASPHLVVHDLLGSYCPTLSALAGRRFRISLRSRSSVPPHNPHMLGSARAN